MNERTKKYNRKIAVTAALSALTIVLAITHLGYIPCFSGVSITVLHVPVVLAAVLMGLVPGVTTGLVFGLTSLIMAATMPTGPLDPLFVNPLISVLPRILFAISVWVVYKAIGMLTKKFPSFTIIVVAGIAAFLGTLLHSVFVLGALVIAKPRTWELMWGVIIANSFLEAGAATIITVAVVSFVMITNKKKKSKLSQEEE